MSAAGRLGTLAVLASLLVLPLIAAEPDEPGDKSAPTILLPTDKNTGTQLAAAADYIASADWKEAVRLLQHVLEGKEDVMVERRAGGGTVLVSARAEARRLLAGLPPAGKEFYETTYGPAAADLLKQARKLRDREKLARVAARYLYTAAAPEALEELAREEFRAGEWAQAGRHYEELLEHRGVARWTTEDLYQAALAARRGRGEGADRSLLRELLTRAGAEGIRIGNRTITREQLREELEKAAPATPAEEWPIYRGGAARTNQGIGGPAFLESRWKQPMIYLDTAGDSAKRIKEAREAMKNRGQPLLPAFFPVTATVVKGTERRTLLLFKNFWGVQAVNLKTGKLEWNSPSAWSLERMLEKKDHPGKSLAINKWLQFYVGENQWPGVVFENSTVGTLSTDGRLVYVVEDFAVPPPPEFFHPRVVVNDELPGRGHPQEFRDVFHYNRLQVFDLAFSGKLAWEVGSFGEKDNPLSESYFLGPPLPLRGLLYLLTQKEKELRLVCLDPQARGKVVSVLPLARTASTLLEDYRRRTQAAHLACDDGILVVPTNAGAVFGIDLKEDRLAWAHVYGKEAADRGEKEWQVTAPAIHEGKVVFAAPDARAVYCLNLRDGAVLWKSPRRDDDLYFAGVVNGKALVVGKKTVRALGLEKGETLWTLDTGLPSGQGIASGGVYYLPLSAGAHSREPEILAIDAARGTIASRARSRTKEVPGNLVFHEGDVISQNADMVTAYPQLEVKMAQMDELLQKNPNDPEGLANRADLRLDQGDLRGAIEDLRKALANKPAAETRARVRAKLYEALTDYFQRDFNAAEKYREEYERLCRVEIPPEAEREERGKARKEESRRRAQLLFLVARGREQQGKLLDALESYLDLAAEGSEELVPSFEDPAVRVRRDVWARSRIDELLEKATPEQRKQLEEEIESRRKRAEGAMNPADLRAFVTLFGPESAGGRIARLALAGRLIEDGPQADREAELLLEAVRGRREDVARTAQATEMLARLNVLRGRLPDAVYYYRLLARDFPKVALPAGQTGQEIWDNLVTDKRFLPFLDAPSFRWGRIKVATEPGQPMTNQVYHFEHIGEPLPYFQQHTLGLHFGTHQLQLSDSRGSESTPVWTQPLTRTMFQNIVSQPNIARFSYSALGHLVVLPVGHLVFGIDPVNRKVLWERSLVSATAIPPGQVGPPWHQLIVDPKDGGVLLLYSDGWAQRVGGPPVLGPSVLCLLTHDGLQGIDPLTGKTLWQRTDVTAPAHLFGDGEVVCVVEKDNADKARATRVLRLADGTTVKAPDFADLYEKRLRTDGRRLLLSESKDGLTLRLYDVAAGKDVWTKSFPAHSTVLRSEDPHLAGVVEPDGKILVFDIHTQKEVLITDKGYDLANPKTGIDPGHLAKLQGIALLSDDQQIYLACNGQPDPNLAPFGGVQPNLMPGLGLRSVPINGRLHTYDRRTGTFKWGYLVPNQMIALDHFQEMPVLLFTSRYQKWQNAAGRRNVTMVASVMSADKRTGKWLYSNDNLQTHQQFHGLEVDAHAGRIKLTSVDLTVVHQSTEVPAAP